MAAADEVTVIDSLTLAYEALQSCRHGDSGTEAMLTLSVYALDCVDRTGYLEVEVPVSSLSRWSRLRVAPLAQRHAVRELLPQQQRLFALMKASVVELDRLSSSHPSEKVLRSLGYALHVLPSLIRRGGFNVRLFRGFCFRVGAYAWSDLSDEMRRILCELAETRIDRVNQLIKMDGFAVKIYTEAPIPFDQISIDDFSIDDLDWS
jgi:hypothetical protein